MVATSTVTTLSGPSMGKREDAKVASPFANYIARQMEISDVRQREIAEHLGYTNPNIITMFKKGLTKVPLDKVPALAEILGLDPRHLMVLALREYHPGLLKVVQDTMGQMLSRTEMQVIEVFREATKDEDPAMTKERRAALKKAIQDIFSAK